MGSDYVNSQTGYQLIDTLSVNLSTIIIDTLKAPSSGSILLGHHSDETFGDVSCSSFFQLGIPDTLNIETTDTYDSLALVLTYNKYAYGDTTLLQKILVHQLTEVIDEKDSLITNQTTYEYNPNPIGSIVYTPSPNNPVDTLVIRIDDAIGRDLYTKIIQENSIVTNINDFIDYFKGLALIVDDAYKGCIVGFEGDVGKVKLSFFTTRKAYDTEHLVHEFSLYNTSKQFNHITHDFSTTQLSALINQKNPLPSTETNGLAYLYGGIGLAIRVDYPSLGDFYTLIAERY